MSDQNTSGTALKRTPLYDRHRALGARLVEFGGWEMPVQYSGILEEHKAVRQRAGLFDVSHMGEFRVEGAGALAFLQSLVPNDVARLADNQALYSQICLENGGTLDDLIIYRRGEGRYMVVVNAGTMEKDWNWFSQHGSEHDDLTLNNASDATGLIALQGPLAQRILQPLTETPLESIVYYHCQPGAVAGIECTISRTGYTGEDGFELYCAADQTGALWDALLAAGQPEGLLPCGLGARDTLRLEAGYCLYGHELTESITPLEAGLGWTVKLGKGVDFIGRKALEDEKRDGLRQKLVGIVPRERGIPRAGYGIYCDPHEQLGEAGERIIECGERIGEVTSGTQAPTLGHPVALGYVPPSHAAPGTDVAIDIRGKLVFAEIVPLPFYKRPPKPEPQSMP